MSSVIAKRSQERSFLGQEQRRKSRALPYPPEDLKVDGPTGPDPARNALQITAHRSYLCPERFDLS